MSRAERHRIFDMSKNKMNKKTIAPIVVTVTALFSGIATAQTGDSGFKKRVYLGVGAGQSTLEPDTSQVDGIDVTDENDTAFNLTLGFDLTRRITLEAHFADLGEAELTGNAGIEYRQTSVSGLYYLWNGFGTSDFLDADGLDRRAGLSLYGRLGVGAMDNEAVGEVEFERDNDVQLIVGLGLEYALPIGLGVRGEFIRFDTDAEYAGLNLLYRFGRPSSASTLPKAAPEIEADELPDLPAPEPVETLPPPPLPEELLENAAVAEDDIDGDGVVNQSDECSDTVPGTPVNSSGCAMFNGTLEGVNFLTSSDTLTETARAALDDVISTLNAFPDVRVSVHAHTDSQGPEAANLALSRNRALSVVRYLIAQGISLDRLEARAFGEEQPIADNKTRAGRLLNRRVEFRSF